MVGSLDSREVVRVFAFPTLPLMNPITASNFKQEQKVQTYIRVLRHAFGCDPKDSEVM